VSEITTTVVNGTSKVLTVAINNAPKLDLVIDGQVRQLYAFQDATLKEIRMMANLNVTYRFFYEGLAISFVEEVYVFVKEIAYGSKIIISSKNMSTGIVIPRPVPIPVLPPVVVPPVVKPPIVKPPIVTPPFVKPPVFIPPLV
jgi:hypothetical protein